MTDQTNKFSPPFREMAERIERNVEGEFAGAMLIVPPQGDPIAVMITDPKQDLEAFLSLCAAKIEIATKEQLMRKEGMGGGWTGQRR